MTISKEVKSKIKLFLISFLIFFFVSNIIYLGLYLYHMENTLIECDDLIYTPFKILLPDYVNGEEVVFETGERIIVYSNQNRSTVISRNSSISHLGFECIVFMGYLLLVFSRIVKNRMSVSMKYIYSNLFYLFLCVPFIQQSFYSFSFIFPSIVAVNIIVIKKFSK